MLARRARAGLVFLIMALASGMFSAAATAAPYAAMVMDARTGEILHATNADTRLHPASLTKMMTLYLAFEAIQRGAISLDTRVTISAKAAAEPPSRLGLRAGQKIAMRHLIRAAAIKSANDAATAIAEAVSGSEARFAERMNVTAKALGMNSTSFRNAHGLTAAGHLSTARDMTILGRRLFYDYPQYYNIFSRRTADAGIAQVANTNRRFLDSYSGADGIKTGYTRAAGFNLVSSAERGNKRVIATVFGGTSTAQRNTKMAELLDLGFNRAPNRVREIRPAPVLIAEAPRAPAAQSTAQSGGQTSRTGQTQRVAAATQLRASPRPQARPRPVAPVATDQAVALALAAPLPAAVDRAEAAAADARAAAVAEALAAEIAAAAAPVEAPVVEAPATQIASAGIGAPVRSPRPAAAPGARRGAPAPAAAEVQIAAAPAPEEITADTAIALDLAEAEKIGTVAAPGGPVFIQTTEAQPETQAMAAAESRRSDAVILASLTPEIAAPAEEREVVARMSTSGGRHWGISLGRFASQSAAERILLRTALMESETLEDSLRKIAPRASGYEANFVGLTQEGATLACRRLIARNTECTVVGP